jgi:hypothetical protein
LADLAIEEGHAADAETPALETKDEFRQEGQADDELIAAAVLAKALLAEGKAEKAKAIIDNSSPLAAKNQNRGVALKFAITAARVTASSANQSLAKSNLEAALAEAAKDGFVGYQFEARLALCEIEMRSDKKTVGQDHLRELARAASSKGFGLIAPGALTAAAGHATH